MKPLLRSVLAALALSFFAGCSSTANAQTGNKYLVGDAPESETYPNTWTVLTNTGYESAYDETFKNPVWVAYHLSGPAHTPSPRPAIGYPTDNRTQAKLTATDYPSGYDHGHMAPNNAIATYFTDAAQDETFLMSNMLPQRHGLNAGPWKSVETAEVKWVPLKHDIWVICGPVYTRTDNQPITPTKRLGPKKVCVPPYCFKIIITKDSAGKFETLAFIMPQEKATGHKPKEFLTSIREVEERTGLNFFASLKPAEQDAIEEEVASDLWPVN